MKDNMSPGGSEGANFLIYAYLYYKLNDDNYYYYNLFENSFDRVFLLKMITYDLLIHRHIGVVQLYALCDTELLYI